MHNDCRLQERPDGIREKFYSDPIDVCLASWRNGSLSCDSRHRDIFTKQDNKSIWIIPPSAESSSQAYRILLGCDLRGPTTVSVPVSGLWEKSPELNWRLEEKALLLLKEHFPLAFGSSSITRGHMQGKGHKVTWHAMQHFSVLLIRCSGII